jgi:hypothetical protein
MKYLISLNEHLLLNYTVEDAKEDLSTLEEILA